MGFTLADLQKADENKKALIARYYEELNKATAQIQALKEGEELKKANREGNIAKLREISAAISDLERDVILIREAIERETKENYYTDSDVIEAANDASKAAISDIAKLVLQYEKDAQKLAKDAFDLAYTVQITENARNACLNYHSQRGHGNSESIFSREGLASLPTLPNINNIFGLLQDAYPAKAEAIRTILFGQGIPEFVNEREDA